MTEVQAMLIGAAATAFVMVLSNMSNRREKTIIKRLVIDLCRAFVKQTSNTLDDRLVDLLEQNLFPKLN